MIHYESTLCTTGTEYLGESARWDERRGELMWVDQLAGPGFLYRARARGAEVEVVQRYELPGSGSAFAPVRGRDGVWLVAMDMALWTMDVTGDLTLVRRLEAPEGDPVHLNDGAADPWGRFWVGSMADDAAPGRASLYRIHAGEVSTVLEGLTISNGLGWSPDRRTMYVADSGPGTITAFDLDADGEMTGSRIFADFDVDREGTPDGLCVDVEGGVWVAVWGGYEVRHYAPTGQLLGRVRVPTAQPASCALGGESGTTLYITTAREDLTEEQLAREPLAGRMFASEVGVRGLPLCDVDVTVLEGDPR